ncbi:MAG TPA: response regulator [Polyangia bacterium]|nr:response regulator [Polyangia bacterium]
MPSALIVLSGPPLPGRWSLARALAERCGARRHVADSARVAVAEIAESIEEPGSVLVGGDLPTQGERAALLELAGEERRCVLVEWRCTREEAEREVFHRYKSRPRILGSAELARFVEDARLREPIGDEARGVKLVTVEAGEPIDDAVERVAQALGLPPPAPASGAPARKRVMVVDDDPDERELLADVLGELGYEVEQAPDAGVALVLLDETPGIELLISDERMPGMTGVELTQVVAERHPSVRTVLLTAFSDEEICRRAVEASAVTVLAKPLSVIDLERVLDETH